MAGSDNSDEDGDRDGDKRTGARAGGLRIKTKTKRRERPANPKIAIDTRKARMTAGHTSHKVCPLQVVPQNSVADCSRVTRATLVTVSRDSE